MENRWLQELETKEVDVQDFLRAFHESWSDKSARHVLIVDDEPSVRRMVSRSMKTVDPEVTIHEAENGRDALEVLQSIRKNTGSDPVLIVTDLQMPVMDGWEFIDQLWKECEERGRKSGTPLIVLSASSGSKGFFGGTSIHGGKSKYSPLVAIAKEDCIKPLKYDSQGEVGLKAWLKHFLG